MWLQNNRAESAVAQPFRAAPAAVGRPKGLRYERPPANLSTDFTERVAQRGAGRRLELVGVDDQRGAEDDERRAARWTFNRLPDRQATDGLHWDRYGADDCVEL